MPTLVTVASRLRMRYAQGTAFTFNNVNANATDENVYDLAQAFASLQVDTPTQITRVFTRYLEL